MVLQHLHTAFIVLSVLTRTCGQNASTIERISFLLGQFCPTDDVCLSNRTVQQSPESDKNSCCTGCSCDDACHLSMNCCFPKLAEKNDVPETVDSLMFYHSTCIYPFTTIPDNKQKIDIDSYRMISSEESESSTESCGNQIVAPWGSLFPVYSKRKDMIFKNSACAEAYDVIDGIPWNAFLICQFNTGNITFLNDGATFTVHPERDIPNDCYVYFQFPADEIETHVCYIAEDFIKTCSSSNYFVPTFVDMDKDEIMTSCTSGLMAPYKYADMFANIFCFICNGFYFYKEAKCFELDGIAGFARSINVGFVGMLNTNYLLPNKKVSENNKSIRLACQQSCIEVGTNACCREILCPSGKSRDFDGNCNFPTDRWYNTEYEVVVNLSASHDVDLQELFMQGSNVDVFKRTWPNNWYIFKVLHVINDGIVRNIIVSIKIPYADIDPKTLILNVLKMMERQWGLFVDDKFIPLLSRFSKLSLYYGYYETTIISLPNVTTTQALPILKVVYSDNRIPARIIPFCITKLYYCKQVELLKSEYIMNVSTDFLYNKLTGRLMLNGEFTLINKNGIVVPRVCLDGSGLMESAGSRHTFTGWILALAMVTLIQLETAKTFGSLRSQTTK